MDSSTVFKTAFDITGWFETGDQLFTAPSGNFDGQGLSWGPRQNCIGQGSLQPLLCRMFQAQEMVMRQALPGSMFDQLQSISKDGDVKSQLASTIQIMNGPDNRLLPAWKQAFQTLGANDSIQSIFMDDARASIPAVENLAAWLSVGPKPTVREWCLAFDFVTQNGGFNSAFRVAVSAFLLALKPFQKDAKDRLRAMCWLRAGWSYILGNRAFALDVLTRKLLIVEGHGKFRGGYTDLDAKFGIVDEVIG